MNHDNLEHSLLILKLVLYNYQSNKTIGQKPMSSSVLLKNYIIQLDPNRTLDLNRQYL